jgi:hypothetical protein
VRKAAKRASHLALARPGSLFQYGNELGRKVIEFLRDQKRFGDERRGCLPTREVNVQRFSVTSSKTFREVVVAFEAALGIPT